MNTSAPPAGNPRTRDAAETPAADETLAAHAKRALRTRIQARITALLDAGIAFLQKLRRKTGGAEAPAEDEERPGARRDSPRDRRNAPPEEPVAPTPKPRRRLRGLLIVLAAMLVGAGAGGAGAYVLFQKQLGPHLAEKLRLKTELARKTRPTGELAQAFAQEQARRARAEQKLTASLAEYAESTGHSYALLEKLLGEQLAESQRMQAALAETTRSSTEARKALTEEQARRTQAEEKLAATVAEHEASSKEQERLLAATEKQLIKAERQLDKLLGDDSARIVSPRETRTRSSHRSERPERTGNCTLAAGSADALKNCIEKFNR